MGWLFRLSVGDRFVDCLSDKPVRSNGLVYFRVAPLCTTLICSNANIVPSIGHENNIAQPKTDKWFN